MDADHQLGACQLLPQLRVLARQPGELTAPSRGVRFRPTRLRERLARPRPGELAPHGEVRRVQPFPTQQAAHLPGRAALRRFLHDARLVLDREAAETNAGGHLGVPEGSRRGRLG